MARGDVKKARRIGAGIRPPGESRAPAILKTGEAAVAAAKAAAAARNHVILEGLTAPIPIQSIEHMQLARQRDILHTAAIEEVRELSLSHPWFLLILCLFPKTWSQHYLDTLHKQICDELVKLGYGEEFWAFLPRQARKSYIITFLHSIWLILNDPDIRILSVGARKGVVTTWATLLRSVFVKDNPTFERFQTVFPDYVFPSGFMPNLMEWTHPLRRTGLADPTLRFTYIGIAGAGWRTDVIKYNDVVERRNCTNPEMAIKLAGQMLDLRPLLDQTGKYMMATGEGTRWAYFDPYHTVIGENVGKDAGDTSEIREKQEEARKSGKLRVMVRHALENTAVPCSHCPKHIPPHGHPDYKNGVSILHPVFTREMVEDELNRYRTDPNRGESMWWHQYMNVCKAPSTQKFKAEWFATSHLNSFPAAKLNVLAVDSADKDFQKLGAGDRMVALFGEFDDYGRLMNRFGIESKHWTRDQFIREIVLWCKQVDWWPHRIAKEKFGGDTFLTDIARAFAQHGRLPQLVPVSRPTLSTGNFMKKLDYIVECLQAPFERREIVFGRDFPPHILRLLIDELLNLGSLSHDDVGDTEALFFDPSVRLFLPRQDQPASDLQPMPLDLYEPAAALGYPQVPSPPLENPTSLGQAVERLRELGVDGYGIPAIHLDEEPTGPQRLQIDFDPWRGSGG